MGIRPEDVHRVNKTQPLDYETFNLKVSVAELLGAEYFVHLDFVKDEIIAKVDTNEVITSNQSIEIYFDKKKYHLFDPITTKRII